MLLVRILKRIGLGFLIGMAAGNLIAFFTTLGKAPIVTKELIDACGNEVTAVIVQTFLSGLIGAAGIGGMLLYEIDKWSMLLTMSVHFASIIAVFVPVCLILHWADSAVSLLIMVGVMLVAYVAIWLIMCAIYRSQVKKLNDLQSRLSGSGISEGNGKENANQTGNQPDKQNDNQTDKQNDGGA